MSAPTDREVKKGLKKIGETLGFSCKNEYELIVQEPWGILARIDHVWFKKIPILEQNIPIVAFEITTTISKLWSKKLMKGDITNLRLSQAALGVLIIPKEKWKQNPPPGWENWVWRIDGLLENLKKIASPMRVEIWDLDQVLLYSSKLA